MAVSLRLAGAVAAGVVLAGPAVAQRSVPATFAITNARIVPVSGAVIEKGTIVVRNGLIASVGANITVPADARVIDATGLSVYPGLIDGYTSLGQGATVNAATAAAAAALAGAGRGGRGTAATTEARPEAAPNSNYVVGLRPEVSVVGELDLNAGDFDAAHGAGVTTALTGVANGIFRGTSALINLDGDSVAKVVIRPDIAQGIGFSRGGGRGGGGGGGGGGRGGYPGTLFGAFATLRQELLDAEHYHDVKAAYGKNPRRMQRPGFDASLEALQPVLAREQPVIMQANTEREIIRALDLAREFNLKPIIAGGAEAYKVVGRLKAENVAVILSLNFPRAGAAATGGRGGGGGEPGDPEPIRMLRERVMQPKAAKMLTDSGVKVIFESGADYTDMLANARKTVTTGLTPDQALRAMTLGPAELFGVADRLGSIEAGKIANLTLSKGDLLSPDGHVTQLFIDGNPIMVTAAAPATGGGGGRGNRPGMDASGAWTMTVAVDHKDYTVSVHIYQAEGRLYGVIEGDLGASDILDGEIDADGSFYFTGTLSLHGSDEFEFDGTLDRQGMRGEVSSESHAGSFAGSHSN
jgi:imidazolonepropionase-like amidohydrolase